MWLYARRNVIGSEQWHKIKSTLENKKIPDKYKAVFLRARYPKTYNSVLATSTPPTMTIPSDLVPQPGNFLLYFLSAILLVVVVALSISIGFQPAFILFILLPIFTAIFLFIKFIAFFIRQLNPGIFSFRLTATFYPRFHVRFVSNTHIIGSHELGYVITSSDSRHEIHLEPIQQPLRTATRPDPRTTPATPVFNPPGRRQSQHTARSLRFPPNISPAQQIGLLAT